MFLHIFDLVYCYLRRPSPPSRVARKQTRIAFQGWVATSSPYLIIPEIKLLLKCGMWYAVCGMRYVVCGMWYAVCGMRNVECEMRNANVVWRIRSAKLWVQKEAESGIHCDLNAETSNKNR